MARKVTTAPQAAEALRQARWWLTQKGSGPNAWARWDDLRDAKRRLRELPYSGSPDEDHPGQRKLVVSDHRIIYRVEDPDTGDSTTAGDIRILAVFGPRQP